MNVCCDFDPEHSNQLFSLAIWVYGDLSSNQVWLQKNLFRRYNRNSNILIVFISPLCDLNLGDSNQTLFQGTPAYEYVITIPSSVKKVKNVIHMGNWNFSVHCDLDHRNLIFSLHTLSYDDLSSNSFCCPPPPPKKRVQKKQLKQSYSDNILRQQPDLFTGHCPMMMHHHTKFAYERLSVSEDVDQRQTINNLNVCCEQSSIFTGHFGLWWSTITLTDYAWLQKTTTTKH